MILNLPEEREEREERLECANDDEFLFNTFSKALVSNGETCKLTRDQEGFKWNNYNRPDSILNVLLGGDI